MNLYVVVEGRRTEPFLYRKWLPQLLPGYREIQRVEDALEETLGNTFFLLAGYGYPAYKSRIQNAVKDCVDLKKPFHLLVCVDSEELSVEQRISEVEETVEIALQNEEIHDLASTVIVADCCIETWLLGNAKLIKRTPEGQLLRSYIAHYDVIDNDPEKMPRKPGDRNRADTHFKYLKEAFHERGISYTKKHPGDAAEVYYLNEIIARSRRHQPDGKRHLNSFSRFLSLVDRLKRGLSADI